MFHYRKSRNTYASFPKPTICPFCDEETIAKKVKETKYAYVVPNRVFYDLWESRGVIDHLLVIPKRHVRSLANLTKAEREDVMHLLGDYEGKNYNIYARAVDSKQRSVAHQHTHLIKTDEKQARATVFVKKPYFLWKF